MAKMNLVVEADDRGYFFLTVESGNVTVGDHPAHAEAIIRGLRILRVRCEVEVEQELVVVTPSSGETGELVGPRRLAPGQAVNLGHSRVQLVPIAGQALAADGLSETLDDLPGLLPDDNSGGARPAPRPAAAAAPPVVPAAPVNMPTPPPGSRLVRKLKVIDGADQGLSFTLPESGSTPIGKSHKHADFVLHDLYVSRVHCEIDVQGDKVFVRHVEGANGTLINGKAITQQQELRPGDVLRVGNTQLRLEWAPPDEKDEEPVAELEEKPKPAPKPDPLAALSKLAGQVVGHYRLADPLGRGFAGIVFLAEEVKTKQAAAVKVLSPEFPANNTELQNFVGALKIAQHLQHDFLLPIYGAGKAGPFCWIAREFVEGESLAAVAERLQGTGKINWTRACRLAVHLGEVLAFVHGQKAIHGNITPANVFVRAGDKATMLADLMLVKALAGSQLATTIREKKMHGELPFISPEMTLPDGVPDEQTDLYGVGAVLYLALTGKPPFSAKTDEQIIARIQGLKPDKPTKLQPTIPVEFEEVVLRLLAKKPEDRFPSAKALLKAVDPIAEEHKVKL